CSAPERFSRTVPASDLCTTPGTTAFSATGAAKRSAAAAAASRSSTRSCGQTGSPYARSTVATSSGSSPPPPRATAACRTAAPPARPRARREGGGGAGMADGAGGGPRRAGPPLAIARHAGQRERGGLRERVGRQLHVAGLQRVGHAVAAHEHREQRLAVRERV